MWTSVWLHFYEMSRIDKSREMGKWLPKAGGRRGNYAYAYCMCLYPCLCVCAVLSLEKEMATHSSVLVWRIPGTEEPGGLPSMGSHRVGHD